MFIAYTLFFSYISAQFTSERLKSHEKKNFFTNVEKRNLLKKITAKKSKTGLLLFIIIHK